MNQGIDILRSFHQRSIPYTVQGSTIVVGAKIDVLLEENKKLSDEEKDRIKELNDRLDNPAKYAQYLIRYFQEKDIVELLNDFEKKHKRFDQKDVNKYDIKKLRDILRLAPKTKTEIKKEGTEKVFENDKAVVLKVNTKEASCYYGAGTKWCISARDENMFDHYHRRYSIYFILSKNLPEKDPLNKVAVTVDSDNRKTYYNNLDKKISLSKLKIFNLQTGIFKKLTLQEKKNNFDVSFKSELEGNKYNKYFLLPKYLVENGEVIYDFTPYTFTAEFKAQTLNLRTFKNFPKIVNHLNLTSNKIESLEGSPTYITALDLRNNKLKSLEGISDTIDDLNVNFNQITSLKGLPDIMWNLSIHNNQLTSLKGLPKKLNVLVISINPGEFTEEEVRAVCDVEKLYV